MHIVLLFLFERSETQKSTFYTKFTFLKCQFSQFLPQCAPSEFNSGRGIGQFHGIFPAKFPEFSRIFLDFQHVS